MKRLFSFDVPGASVYDITDALYPIRSLPGVKSVELLSAVEGSPKYCLAIEVEDAQDAAVVARIYSLSREYEGYYSNYSVRAYRKVG